MDGNIKELTAEHIADMEAEELIARVIDVFDYEPIVRASLLTLMRIRARKIGVDDLLSPLIKQYEGAEKQSSVQYAKELAARNTPVQLEYDNRGQPLKTIDNFLRVIRSDPHYAGVRYNQLIDAPEIEEADGVRRWIDADDAKSRWYMERQYGIHNRDKHEDAFMQVLAERAYHPIREKIEQIEWDGVERLATFLPRWTKCEDTPYTREVSRLIFAGGIHRIYNPGCKFDDMVVLIGTKQGEGKSTIVRWLAIEDRFYREVTEFEGQRGMEAVEGAWICEVGELLALTKTKEQEAVKSYLTRQKDTYRKPFGKRVTDNPRQCVFIGTTNKEQFLTDKTGGRRFFPVLVRSSGYELFDRESEIRADIAQCWAEALVRMRAGTMPPYADRELVGMIRVEQDEAQEDDYRVGLIAKYLKGKEQVCGIEIWEEALDRKFTTPTPRDFMDIRLIMQGMEDWERSRERASIGLYGQQRIWRKKVDSDRVDQTELFVDVTGEEELPF